MVMFMIVVIYLLLRRKSRFTFEMMKSTNWKKKNAAIYSLYINLLFYPLGFIILNIPGTVNRILDLFDVEWGVLIVIQQITIPIKGLVDVIIFGLANYVLRSKIFGESDPLTEKKSLLQTEVAERDSSDEN